MKRKREGVVLKEAHTTHTGTSCVVDLIPTVAVCSTRISRQAGANNVETMSRLDTLFHPHHHTAHGRYLLPQYCAMR